MYQTPEKRFHALDTVRACALLAGIVLHAIMPFLPGFREIGWPISDTSTSAGIGILYFVIHIFRMTLFFIIAGFFARVLHQRLGTKGLLVNRLKRIGLPMIAAFMFVMPLSIIPFIWAARQLGIQGPPKMEFPVPVIGPMIPLGHLWFLYMLLFIYVAVPSIRSLLAVADTNHKIRAKIIGFVRFCFKNRLIVLVLGLPLAAVLFSTSWWVQWQGIPLPIVGLIPNFPAILAFSSAFIVGWCMHKEQDFLKILASDWPLYLIWAAVGASVSLFVAGIKPSFYVMTLETTERAIYATAYTFAEWCGAFAVIGIAVSFIKTPNAKWRYLADASYWMYIIHLPILWWLQAWMMQWPLNWSVKLLLSLFFTSGLLLLSYHYLVRSTFLGKFLNGRKYPKAHSITNSATHQT